MSERTYLRFVAIVIAACLLGGGGEAWLNDRKEVRAHELRLRHCAEDGGAL